MVRIHAGEPNINTYATVTHCGSYDALVDTTAALLEWGKLTHAKWAGVPLLAGSDTGASNEDTFPGFSLQDELIYLVQAGLTPMEALQCATLNAATWLGQRDSLGTIEPGKLADLVLLDANPLQDIHNIRKIRAVVFNGRLLDRDRLDQMLAAVETVKSPR